MRRSPQNAPDRGRKDLQQKQSLVVRYSEAITAKCSRQKPQGSVAAEALFALVGYNWSDSNRNQAIIFGVRGWWKPFNNNTNTTLDPAKTFSGVHQWSFEAKSRGYIRPNKQVSLQGPSVSYTLWCLRVCHQKGVKSSTGKKVFLVSLFASEGKTDEGKEFDPIHDRRVNGKSLFATFQARRS